MKILSLNTWGGRAGKENLLGFFRKHKDVDILCLQEAWEGGEKDAPEWGEGIDTAMVSNVSKIFDTHKVFFYPHYFDHYGIAMFVRKELDIVEEGEIFVFKDKERTYEKFDVNHPRNIQYVTVKTPNGLRTIVNFHGLWNGQGKSDTDERIIQSDNIAKFIKNISNPSVLVGDFNLLPETKSLKILEEVGMIDLIKKFNITNTRSSHYTKPIRFADYTLVSKDIKVNDFQVLPDEVSDHLAMYLDFE